MLKPFINLLKIKINKTQSYLKREIERGGKSLGKSEFNLVFVKYKIASKKKKNCNPVSPLVTLGQWVKFVLPILCL